MDDAPINILPNEIWDKIFECLPLENIFRISQVCRKLYEISHKSHYYMTNILKNKNRDVEEYKDYVKFMPLCCKSITNFKYVKLWENLPIEYIICFYHSQLLGTQNIISNYIRKCSNIVSLTLYTFITQNTIEILEEHLPKTIKILNITNSNNTESNSFIEYNSKKLPQIKKLTLTQLRLKNTSSFDNIEHLILSYVTIDVFTSEFQINISNIKKIKIDFCFEFLEDIKFLKKIEELSIYNNSIYQHKLKLVSENENIKKLKIFNNKDFQNVLDLSVFKTSNIQYLTLNKCCNYILNLNGLENIKNVNLNGTRISNIHNTKLN